MNNKNVIEIIDRLMNPEADKVVYSASEVFTAVAHGYYYIKSGKKGKNAAKFLNKIFKVLKNGDMEYEKNYSETKYGIPFNEWIWGKMSADALCIIKSMFDEEYYASQVSKMCMNENYDKNLLEHYLYWLDEEELKSVFEGIITFKYNFDAFISDNEFEAMIDELKECSNIVIENSPYYMLKYDEHMENISTTLDFCFEYLCRETIIDIICRHIDIDPLGLACMIKAFRYSDSHTAAAYTSMALHLAREWDLDVFNPFITDTSKICQADCDANNHTVIHRNKRGKVAII